MQSSLLAEPIDRNIKAADVAEIGDIAKIFARMMPFMTIPSGRV
jgi:hypothetical protein